MDNSLPRFAGCVTARYVDQRIPRYQGNPLIEALPKPLSEDEVIEALTLSPEFSPQQRQWSTQERIQQLFGLGNFSVPMLHQIQLTFVIDAAMRDGYVGRRPRSVQSEQLFQHLYELQQRGVPMSARHDAVTPQVSGSLIGVSGMGKTTSVQRILSRIPRVIYHPELNIYQIPYLHIEAPSDGMGVKSLAHEILQHIDRLVPDADYYHEYAIKGRPGADTLMRSVARVMHMHSVGLLVCDEIQNLANSAKGPQRVMTELVSACNTLQVPILFIGTNKARKVLSVDFRQARRTAGLCIAPWVRLQRMRGDPHGDWNRFATELWRFQWVRNPIDLNDRMLDVLYHFTQGVPDLAIKLFCAAQARAMYDGSERLTEPLLKAVHDEAFWSMHAMLAGLRDNDPDALAQFDDIAPLKLEAIFAEMDARYSGARLRAASVRPDDERFVPQVVSGLVSIGVGEEQAVRLAEQASSCGAVGNVLDATEFALSKMRPPKSAARPRSTQGSAPDEPIMQVDLSDRPADYRRAAQQARTNGTTVLDELRALGMAADLEATLPLA